MKKVILLLIKLLLVVMVLNGQEHFRGASINPKFGAYNYGESNSGIVNGWEINYFTKGLIFSAGMLNYAETQYSISFQNENYSQYALLFGKYKGNKYFRMQYQAGLSMFSGLSKIGYDFVDHGYQMIYEPQFDYITTIGIPLKVGFKFIPISFLSIGVDFEANVNFETVTYMTMLSFELGNIREVEDKKN